MRKPVVVVNVPILERCLRKHGQIVDYFKQVTQPTLLVPVRKSRDLTLDIQLVMVRRPVLETYTQGKSLNLLKSINIPCKIWVPDDGAVLKVGADELRTCIK